MSKIVKDLTPPQYRACGIGACPSIFATDEGTYLLIGKTRDNSTVPDGRVGEDEIVIEIPKDLLKQLR